MNSEQWATGFPFILFLEGGSEPGKIKKDVSVKKRFRFFMITAMMRAKNRKLKDFTFRD